MSATGLDVFDRTLHLTNTWLDEMMDTLPRDRQLAWHALGAVLRTVRDRIPVELSAHFGAQLPLLVRGTFYDQWQPGSVPQSWRSTEEFLAIVAQNMGPVRPMSVADAAGAVFRVVNHHVDPGQVRKVRDALPADVRALWPENNQQSTGERRRRA